MSCRKELMFKERHLRYEIGSVLIWWVIGFIRTEHFNVLFWSYFPSWHLFHFISHVNHCITCEWANTNHSTKCNKSKSEKKPFYCIKTKHFNWPSPPKKNFFPPKIQKCCFYFDLESKQFSRCWDFPFLGLSCSAQNTPLLGIHFNHDYLLLSSHRRRGICIP